MDTSPITLEADRPPTLTPDAARVLARLIRVQSQQDDTNSVITNHLLTTAA